MWMSWVTRLVGGSSGRRCGSRGCCAWWRGVLIGRGGAGWLRGPGRPGRHGFCGGVVRGKGRTDGSPGGVEDLFEADVVGRKTVFTGGVADEFTQGLVDAEHGPNSLASLFPDVAVELDLEAPATAGLAADQIVAGSHRRVGWRCSTCGHRWEATVGPRTDRRRAGCPACAGHVVTAATNLAVLRPDLATQWHPTRNGALRPEDVRPGSSASVWWQCPAHEDHQWPAIVSARSRPTNPTGCPACSGYQVSATNNLAALFPSVARQLDPASTRALRPIRFSPAPTTWSRGAAPLDRTTSGASPSSHEPRKATAALTAPADAHR